MCIQLWGQAILVKDLLTKVLITTQDLWMQNSQVQTYIVMSTAHLSIHLVFQLCVLIMMGLSCTLMYCACRTYPQEGHSLYIIFCNTWDEDECFGMLLWKKGTLNEYFIIIKNSLKVFQICFHKWIPYLHLSELQKFPSELISCKATSFFASYFDRKKWKWLHRGTDYLWASKQYPGMRWTLKLFQNM
jgi:hypothetical protein